MPASELAKEIEKRGKDVEAMESLQAAVDKAYEHAGKDDVIIAFGSLSYLGALTEIVKTYEETEK